MKMHRRMQRRIQMVVEERRIALGADQRVSAEGGFDPERTVEIPPFTPVRAIGRVTVEVV
jgi:hypothetical protein